MDKQSIVNFMQLEEVTGIKLLDDNFTNGPIFITGAAAKTFSNVSINRETLALLVAKMADISRSALPKLIADEKVGYIFDEKEIANILVSLTDEVSNYLLLEREILQGEEKPEGVSLVDLMRQKMTERTMHDVSKVFYDYGRVSVVPSPKVRKLDAQEQKEYAITFSESDLDQMGEYLPHDVHHALITAFNQRVEKYEEERNQTVEQGD